MVYRLRFCVFFFFPPREIPTVPAPGLLEALAGSLALAQPHSQALGTVAKDLYWGRTHQAGLLSLVHPPPCLCPLVLGSSSFNATQGTLPPQTLGKPTEAVLGVS
jgi:hypothetical protein